MKNVKNKINKSIKDGNFLNRLATVFISLLGYSNTNIAGLEMKYKTFRYLKRHYKKDIDTLIERNQSFKEDRSGDDNIWICWFQGVENAPALVKKCIASIYKHMPDKSIHIITRNNMREYIELPDFIEEKWKKGLISNTKISNILRMELLYKYGGVWMDSTIFLTGKIPDYIYSSNIFMFTIDDSEDVTRKLNNYFIYSQKGHPFLKTLIDIHYIYWSKENKVREYFLWHLLATLCLEGYKKYFNGMFYVPDEIPHMMSHVIFDSYSTEYYTYLKNITSIHKLSNKFEIPNYEENTYYSMIISGEIG